MNTANNFTGHPLGTFVNFPSWENEEEKESKIYNHIRQCDMSLVGPFNLYMLVVVNDIAANDPEALLGLWEDNTTEFGVYVGITRNGPFRKEHLLNAAMGGRTSVSKFLRENSNVYLALQQKFETYIEVCRAEAQMIAILRARREEQKKTGRGRRFKCVNIMLPGIPLFESTEEEKRGFDKFMKTGFLPFRFMKEPYTASKDETGIFRRHLVILNILSSAKKLVDGKDEESHDEISTEARKDYKCKKCGKKFSRSDTLDEHMKTHKPKGYECEECGKKFSRSDTLDKHMKTHKPKEYECEECGKKFSTNSGLYRHMKTHKPKEYECEECGKKFSRSDTLDEHMKTHQTRKDYKCKKCGKKFSTNSGLYKHMKTHKPKGYECEECGKKFSRSDALNVHMKTHQTRKDYKCKKCGKRFSTNSGLYRHMKTHKPKGYECEECGKKFSRSDALKSHLKCHDDN